MREEKLDAVFGALADSTRRKILAQLAKGNATVTEIAKPLPMTLPAVSKHLDVLERAGLVRRERDGWYQRCHIDMRPLDAATVWLEEHRAFWTDSLEALAAYAKKKKRAP